MTENPRVTRDRYIGKIVGEPSKPAVVFFGGIHGNEPSGVIALERAFEKLARETLKGSVYGVIGNKWALDRKCRYDAEDLNRMWSHDRVAQLNDPNWKPNNHDEEEQIEIWAEVQKIIAFHTGPIYFIDLHTTSSETGPFVVLNDSLLNRSFAKQYPLPIILGIEEYLDGPLLSYINELGYVAFGFEAGSHDDPVSIDVHFAFIMCSLQFTGLVTDVGASFAEPFQLLKEKGQGMDRFYEIFFRYRIKEGESFTMQPGYDNFQLVAKGEQLATSNGHPILADRKARVFMPLYQSQGSEGFFAIRPVNEFFLGLSAILRKRKVDTLLTFLPGIKWHSNDRQSLIVNKNIARFFTKQIFHLLGYRSRSMDRNHLVLKNREAASKQKLYSRQPWLSLNLKNINRNIL